MKKAQHIRAKITLLTVLICISIVASAISFSDLQKRIESLEKATDNTYGCQYIDSELDKIREDIDLSKSDYPIGDIGNDTYWYEYGVRQAWTSTNKDTVCIAAGKEINVLYAYNMSIPDNNNDPSQDRYYKFKKISEPAYLIVGATEGIAVICINFRAE